MKRIVVFIFLALLIAGCAPTQYRNIKGYGDFDSDSNFCDGYALTGGQTITGNNFPAVSPDMNALGNSLATLSMRDRLWEICMKSKGWVEVE